MYFYCIHIQIMFIKGDLLHMFRHWHQPQVTTYLALNILSMWSPLIDRTHPPAKHSSDPLHNPADPLDPTRPSIHHVSLATCPQIAKQSRTLAEPASARVLLCLAFRTGVATHSQLGFGRSCGLCQEIAEPVANALACTHAHAVL